ncbi:MAG TPA: SDR family oxidoreductase [Xanthomonadaceae bacterium]|nr:SDR family oxidoreductase [Xanthomonadaceae bacterium]
MRHCLVTGANRGLGLEFVRQLLARGDAVIATARAPDNADDLQALVRAHRGQLQVFPLDVAQPASHSALVHALPEALAGSSGIDLLVNNAGVLASGERFGDIHMDALDASFRTNAAGPLLLTQALAPLLAKNAVVANISSQLGSIENATRFGTPSYCIGKAAQNMATRLLAAVLAERGIVVVALHPGWVQTDMGGAGASITPKEAVQGLLQVIDGATLTSSGHFLDWRGNTLPW